MSGGVNAAAADILIPVQNRHASARMLLEGIYRYADFPFHIYVIDNNSADSAMDLGKIYTRDISVIRNRSDAGWRGAINQGIRLSRNPYIVFMSSAVEVARGWLANLIAFLDTHSRIGAVGPLSSNPDDRQCLSRVRSELVPSLPDFLTDDLHERNRILSYHYHRTGVLIPGALNFACVALKRRAVNEVGPLAAGVAKGQDAEDYCRRMREAGYVLGLALDTYILRHSDR